MKKKKLNTFKREHTKKKTLNTVDRGVQQRKSSWLRYCHQHSAYRVRISMDKCAVPPMLRPSERRPRSQDIIHEIDKETSVVVVIVAALIAK